MQGLEQPAPAKGERKRRLLKRMFLGLVTIGAAAAAVMVVQDHQKTNAPPPPPPPASGIHFLRDVTAVFKKKH